MTRLYTIYSLMYMATTLISFFGVVLALNRKEVKGAKELAWLMFASGFGTFWIILSTSALTVDEKILWAKFEYIGGVFTPAIFLMFILRFTEKDKYLKPKYILLYLLPFFVTLCLLFIKRTEHLVWSGFSAIYPETNLMEFYHGPVFWIVYVFFAYLMMAVGSVQILLFLIKHKKNYRRQGITILLGSLIPWTSSILYISGINIAPGLDLAPASIALSGIILIYAISYTRLLNLVPVAREALVENIPDGIIALDKQERILDINRAALNLLGIANSKVHGLSIYSVGVSIKPLLEAIIGNNEHPSIEIDTSEGNRIFQIIKKPLKNTPGSRLVIINDITNQILKEREVINAEERYYRLYSLFRLMADNMPDLLWAKDLEKRYIFVNKAMCDSILLATDTEEPIGKPYSYFLERSNKEHPEISMWNTLEGMARDTDLDVLGSGKPIHYFEKGYKNGVYVHLDIRKSPIFDDKGEMIGLVGSARDVTVQKKNEAEIHQRDILLEAIAKATAVLLKNEDIDSGIVRVLEILGNATGVSRVYIFKNQTDKKSVIEYARQIFEWTRDSSEFIGLSNNKEIHYKTIPDWVKEMAEGKVISRIVREMPEEEKTFLLPYVVKSFLLAPIFSDNQFWGFIGFDDCSNEKKWLPSEKQILAAAANTIGSAYFRKNNIDELIQAKELAEQSDRLKTSFLANMSHEIRTPMNGIIGFTELLKEPKLSGEEQQEYIRIIEKSGERLLNIINDIIKISKLESGLVQPVISEVYINELLDYIYRFFLPQVQEKGLVLKIDNQIKDENICMNSDKEKLYAIITNLTRNSIKFTDKGFVEIGCSHPGQEFLFFVKDTGIGMTPEQMKIVFDRFRQGSETIARDYEGSGLGLSISKAYVEMLGGKIWVESQIDAGSAFYFTVKG
ncbi:MAG: histidine kinase N-terminal 7TM domain-containing protein [Rikenellaceae bacterium]|nr:histidine kinase N-terminal 7TM domain-containing protein [Rikenellaceae bacterium]